MKRPLIPLNPSDRTDGRKMRVKLIGFSLTLAGMVVPMHGPRRGKLGRVPSSGSDVEGQWRDRRAECGFLTVPEDQIMNIKSYMTIVDGRVVCGAQPAR